MIFDNPKWLFFLLLGSIFVSLLVGFIDAEVGTSGVAKISLMEDGGFYAKAKTIMGSLSWDFAWLTGPMALFGWVFRILNIGFGAMMVYALVTIGQRFIP